jgi:hypothetical protein
LNNIVFIKRTNAIFLATVLVLGTIATISPSFMVGAQAQEYFGMERDYKKSDKKDVSVKSIKCNNVNVNVNGLELNLTSVPFLSGLLASEAHEGERGASSYGSDGSYGDKSRSDGDFKFICINNNNNTVIGVDDGETPIPPTTPPPVDECLLCFEETTQAVRDAINTFLDEQEEITVADGIVIPADVNNFEDLCDWLADEAPLLLTQVQIDQLIDAFVGQTQPPIPRGDVEDLVQCLIDAGLIEVIPPEPPGQLTLCHRSANQPDQTLTGQNQNQFDAHINNHDGPPGAGPDSPGPCPT